MIISASAFQVNTILIDKSRNPCNDLNETRYTNEADLNLYRLVCYTIGVLTCQTNTI